MDVQIELDTRAKDGTYAALKNCFVELVQGK